MPTVLVSFALTIGCASESSSFTQVQKLVPQGASAADRFGTSLDMDGERAIVGSPGAKAAFIYRKMDGMWLEEARLADPDPALGEGFGTDVAIEGTIAMVSGENESGVGVVYVFEDNGSSWAQVQEFTATVGASNDKFGYRISIDGTRVIVGSPGDNDQGTDSGAAYVFDQTDDTWTETQKLTASNGQAGMWFGASVAANGSNILVGASAQGSISDPGLAYAFGLDNGTWAETQILRGDNEQSGNLGVAIAIQGNDALIGASSNYESEIGALSGNVFRYQLANGTWAQIGRLYPDDGSGSDQFGFSIDVAGSYAVVGAYNDDDNGDQSGSAYVYSLAGSGDLVGKVVADDGEADDWFGYAVAIDGRDILCGSFQDDGPAGTNSVGAVYFFHMD